MKSLLSFILFNIYNEIFKFFVDACQTIIEITRPLPHTLTYIIAWNIINLYTFRTYQDIKNWKISEINFSNLITYQRQPLPHTSHYPFPQQIYHVNQDCMYVLCSLEPFPAPKYKYLLDMIEQLQSNLTLVYLIITKVFQNLNQ